MGVIIGLGVLWYSDALPEPFSSIGYKGNPNPIRLRIKGIRIHHSTLGIGLIGLASILHMFDRSKSFSDFFLGLGMLWLGSQIIEIYQHKTLFWEDFA